MRIGSLFSGYGGLDMGVQDALGGTVAWHAEFDPHPSRILAHHWPGVPNLGDVTAVDWAQVEPVDIICGGSPCQDLSHAGARAGMRDGTRSGLWSDMCAAIETIRPGLVIWENVQGALSAGADSLMGPCELGLGCEGPVPLRALGRVLGDLAELGYDAAWATVSASDVGAPHRRERVFVLAWPATDTDNGGRKVELAGGAGTAHPRAAGIPEPPLLKTPTAQLAVNGGSQHPDKRKAGGHGPTLADEVEHLLPTPTVNDMGAGKTPEAWDDWADAMRARHGNGNGHGPSLSVEAQRFGAYAPAIARWEALTRPAPAPTEANFEQWERRKAARLNSTLPIGMRGSIRLIVDGPPRRLSPAFVEWMMGLPAGHVTDVPGLSRNAQLKALGNGVVPAQAAAALRQLHAMRATHQEYA